MLFDKRAEVLSYLGGQGAPPKRLILTERETAVVVADTRSGQSLVLGVSPKTLLPSGLPA